MTRDKCGFCFQWFGNLVTMEWWNDLWLNEGFAKFMEFVSLDITYPELQVVRTFLYLLSLFLKQPTCRTSKMLSSPQDDFFLGKCFEAMEVDSLSSSHPVSTPVENPTQIQEMFDDVSYDKVRLALSECGLDSLKASGSIQWNVFNVSFRERAFWTCCVTSSLLRPLRSESSDTWSASAIKTLSTATFGRAWLMWVTEKTLFSCSKVLWKNGRLCYLIIFWSIVIAFWVVFH